MWGHVFLNLQLILASEKWHHSPNLDEDKMAEENGNLSEAPLPALPAILNLPSVSLQNQNACSAA